MNFSNSVENTYSGSLSTLIVLKELSSEGLTSDIFINPTNVILNDTIWNMHKSKITLLPNRITVDNFYFNHGNQYLKINGTSSDTFEDSISVYFRDLRLGYISEMVNQKDFSFDGMANGEAYLFQLLKKPFFRGDLSIADGSMNGYLTGDLSVRSFWRDMDKCLVLQGSLLSPYNGKKSQSDITGGVFFGNDSLYLEGKMKDFDLKFLRQYFSAVVQNNTGTASGDIKAYGKFKHIGFEGAALVKNMAFDVGFLQTSYVVSDTLFMTPNSFRVNQAQVFDSEGNYGIVSGLVLHEGFKNFKYAVNITSNHILALNTKETDNDMYYGRAYAAGNVNISGTQEVINFNLNLRSRPGTNVTIPIDKVSSAGSTDFITFVESTDNLSAAEMRRLRRDKIQNIREQKKIGAEINMVFDLEATPDAQVQLIMDPRQGDMIKATGNGMLHMLYNSREGNFKMYGSYEVYKGEYLFTIQSINPYTFDIMEGSLVRWTGNPYDAYLDVRAKYMLNASLTDILDDPSIRTSLTPVLCILNLTGTISNPIIKFDLELPNVDEDIRRKVSSIINTEEAMNRNVASLLALGHFYVSDQFNRSNTNSSSDFSSIGFATLSSQLSNWISKINKDVNIALNYRPIFTGVTTVNEVDVVLSGQLMKDRLQFYGNFGYREDVSNSPNVLNSIIDFDLEYKLFNTGKMRLKGFNHSNNSFLKQSPNTQGVGIIYREDFDTFGELFRSYWNPVKNIFKGAPKKQEETELKDSDLAPAW